MVVNFPAEINVNIKSSTEKIDVVFYYIDKLEDVEAFVSLCKSIDLPKENRTILVFKKGRKDGVNRNAIFGPLRNGKYKNFKLKAPMLCSLSDTLSAGVFCYN